MERPEAGEIVPRRGGRGALRRPRTFAAAIGLVGACGLAGGCRTPAATGAGGAGSGSAAVSAPAEPPLAPAVQPFGFLRGTWRTADGTTESWHPAGDALFGVGFSAGGFECVILAEQDGVVTYRAMPGGQAAVDFRLDEAGPSAVRFVNPDHDFPQLIVYDRRGDQLIATISRLDGSGVVAFRYTRVDAEPAPALAEADRQFERDTGERGAAGWASWFDPAGAMLRPTGRVEGRAAVEEAMKPLLSNPTRRLRWEPLASGLARSGELGFTVGAARLTEDGEVTWRGAYVTVWRRQADGTWRVLFDTGDDA